MSLLKIDIDKIINLKPELIENDDGTMLSLDEIKVVRTIQKYARKYSTSYPEKIEIVNDFFNVFVCGAESIAENICQKK